MFSIGDKVTIKKPTNHIASRFIQDAKDEIVFKIIEECENNGYIIEALTDHHTWWVLEENLLHHTQWARKEINKENKMEFTKSELDNGMVVELRNGMKFLYMNEQLIGKDMYSNILYYNDNLLNLSKTTTMLDIMKVYDVNWGTTYFLEDIFNNLILIWERKKEEIIISKEGKQYLELLLAKGYKWLARDKAIVKSHNGLYAYESKPVRPMTISLSHNEGWGSCCEYTSVGKLLDEFDFVKWEDEQPWDIKKLLENCEVKK